MIYRPQTINFREVYRGDTFNVTLVISSKYPLKVNTRIRMVIKPTGDIPEEPVLIFSTDEDGGLTIDGQAITLDKASEQMQLVRSGRFQHDIQFTTDGVTVTLYKGLFQIMQDNSKLS